MGRDLELKFLEKLQKKKGKDFTMVGSYEGSAVDTLFRHEVCGHEWLTKPKNILNYKGVGCPNCATKNKMLTHEEFAKKLHKISKGEIGVHSEDSYKGSRVPIKFLHSKCGKTFIDEPYLVLKSGSCHHCRGKLSGGRKKTHKDFLRELSDIRNNEYEVVEGSIYTNALEKVTIRHISCGEVFKVRASHILHNSGCPKCKLSKGEELVKSLLEVNNVRYSSQVTIPECKNIRPLPFDFAILDSSDNIKALIEYDGSQHFIPYKHFGGEEKLKKQQANDCIKDKYCLDNSIPLLRIPYTLPPIDVKTIVENFIQEK